MITGTMNVPMTLEKANYLNALEARDIAMPIKLYRYSCKRDDGSEFTPTPLCPVCEKVICGEVNFCSNCGQRLDRENIEL